jgi:stalled ribosome rescue protein Dom34
MKLVYKKVDFKNRIFIVKLVLEHDTDDAWNLYNLISIGDQIRGTCWRKI